MEKENKSKGETVNVRLPVSIMEELRSLAQQDYRSLRDYCKVVLLQHVESRRTAEPFETEEAS